MSNASDSSNSATTSHGSRFGRGFMVRIAAVVLFLGLGTFAVSQALKVKGTDDSEHAHDHSDEPGDSENPESNLAKSAEPQQIATPEMAATNQRQLSNVPKVNDFIPPVSNSFQPKTADRRPAVASRDNTNKVAKTPVTNQQLGNPSGGFQVRPEAFGSERTGTSPVTQVQEKTNELGNSIAEKSNRLLNTPTQSIGDFPLQNRPDASKSPASNLSNPRTNNGNFSLQPPEVRTASAQSDTRGPVVSPATQNPVTPNPTAQNPSTRILDNPKTFSPPASVDSARNLAPLNGPGGLRNTGQAQGRMGIPNPTTGSPPPNANSNANQRFNNNFNVQSPTTQNQQLGVRPQNPAGLAPRQLPGLNGNNNALAQPRNAPGASLPAFNNSPPPVQRNIGNNSPAVQRNAVPTRQASTVRTVTQPTAGVMTRPTPGEKNLEGARTPSLTVQRIAPREIQLNTPANFEIIVRNVGKIEANDVRVFDQIPTGTELLEASPQPSRDPSGAIQWDIGTLAPGQERRIKLKLKPTQPGEIGSVAHVSFGTRSSVRTLVTKPVLEITHSAPRKSLIGDRVPLDIVVTNTGNGPANKVIIQEDIPGQLEYTDGFRQIEFEVGTLAPGQSRKLQLVLQAAKVGTLRNVIFANGEGGLRAQHAVDMEIVAPSLSASSDGPRRRFLRRQATHEFQVQNNGTAAATNVELMAKLPQGLKYVSSNNRGQFDPATNAVYWSLAELDAGVAATVSVVTVPVTTGDQTISFNAVADLKQKATADADLLVEHLDDVFFDIDDVVDHIEIGAETKYQLRVVNQGTKTATNVRLQLDLPNGLRPTKVDGGLQSQIQQQRVTFAPITSMNPGDEIKVEVTAIGVIAGEHKIVATMQTDGRETSISKEETTQVYSDR